jgi:YD repeat-containing protein
VKPYSDPHCNLTTTRFNTRGYPISSTDALGQTSTTVYTAANQVASTTDALGRITKYECMGSDTFINRYAADLVSCRPCDTGNAVCTTTGVRTRLRQVWYTSLPASLIVEACDRIFDERAGEDRFGLMSLRCVSNVQLQGKPSESSEQVSKLVDRDLGSL